MSDSGCKGKMFPLFRSRSHVFVDIALHLCFWTCNLLNAILTLQLTPIIYLYLFKSRIKGIYSFVLTKACHFLQPSISLWTNKGSSFNTNTSVRNIPCTFMLPSLIKITVKSQDIATLKFMSLFLFQLTPRCFKYKLQ